MSRVSRWLRSRRPKPPTPYERLLYVRRFEPRTETLLGKPFRIADGVSFYMSYREIFLDEVYRFRAESVTPRIVDCGANCGVSVAYFKQLYPQARITAVEADPALFALLQENAAMHEWGDVRLVNRAVAAGEGPVTFYRQGADAGRIHALSSAVSQISVPIVSLDELLDEPVDMLKLDIEGAETEVLCTSERLARVSQLMVEYHSFADTSQSLHRLLARLSESGFRYYMQAQFCPARPLVDDACYLDMDLQLNIFAKRPRGYVAASTGPAGMGVGQLGPTGVQAA